MIDVLCVWYFYKCNSLTIINNIRNMLHITHKSHFISILNLIGITILIPWCNRWVFYFKYASTMDHNYVFPRRLRYISKHKCFDKSQLHKHTSKELLYFVFYYILNFMVNFIFNDSKPMLKIYHLVGFGVIWFYSAKLITCYIAAETTNLYIRQ